MTMIMSNRTNDAIRGIVIRRLQHTYYVKIPVWFVDGGSASRNGGSGWRDYLYLSTTRYGYLLVGFRLL
jgi:hypothetical protein